LCHSCRRQLAVRSLAHSAGEHNDLRGFCCGERLEPLDAAVVGLNDCVVDPKRDAPIACKLGDRQSCYHRRLLFGAARELRPGDHAAIRLGALDDLQVIVELDAAVVAVQLREEFSDPRPERLSAEVPLCRLEPTEQPASSFSLANVMFALRSRRPSAFSVRLLSVAASATAGVLLPSARIRDVGAPAPFDGQRSNE